ncbi:MAG: hypothetical protein CMJ78_13145 [Planctomycetaceae bacterium]|nr:hypothetical protein [Planctomycetaceae bacterium]
MGLLRHVLNESRHDEAGPRKERTSLPSEENEKMPWHHYRPTPEQIETECRLIRQDWDERTHRKRWVHPIAPYWNPPKVQRVNRTGDSDFDRD